jgi:hypothetical protein
MNRSTPNLRELAGLFCDGTISPEQAVRLEKLVAESAEARQYVLDTFHVHCEIAWEFGRGSASPEVPGVAVPGFGTVAGLHPAPKINGATAASSPRVRRTRRWFAAAAAVSAVAAVTLVLMFTTRPPRNEIQPAASQVAHIEKVNGVRWRNETAAKIGQPLGAGRKISIEQGIAQIKFESGAAIVVQGPAAIELRSANSVALRSGSLTADVPAAARGFEVYTPHATVVDLGTRFGVACETKQTEVEVFSGIVLLRPDAGAANRPQELRLAAHEAARITGTPGAGPMQMAPIAAGSRNFVQSVDDCYPHLAPACECPDVPQAAAELVGPWHCPQGKLVPIDLSRHANWSHAQSTPDRVSNNLVELPLGPRTLAGVEFDIASRVIQLRGIGLPKLAQSVQGIPVGRRVARLYILQGSQFCGPEYGVQDGELVAEYRLRYADGDRAAIPAVYGSDVRDWWASSPNPVTRGQVAWVGYNPETRHNKKYLHLYLCTWENPHPEKVVESIDFVALHKFAGPFCVAITAEEPPPAHAPIHGDSGVNR